MRKDDLLDDEDEVKRWRDGKEFSWQGPLRERCRPMIFSDTKTCSRKTDEKSASQSDFKDFQTIVNKTEDNTPVVTIVTEVLKSRRKNVFFTKRI